MLKGFFAKRYGVVVAAVLLGAVVPLLVSCGDDKEPAGPSPPAFTYPHMNGAVWIYSYKGQNATKYAISGNYNHPTAGDTQKLYEYVTGQSGWEESFLYYLKVSENDVRLYLHPEESRFLVLLKFPLKEGNSWDAGLGMTANVASKENVSVPAGSFDCYKIDYTSAASSFTFWFPSNVGGMGAKNHGWWTEGGKPIAMELASFNLPT
jgi:hypothetical protein